MAFDGITIAALVQELNTELKEGRISKIAQPEKDELLLTIKTPQGQRRLVLSANPSLPLVYLTEENKVSPATAPGFTMLLRKHLQNGRIIDIFQPDFERIIVLRVEHLDEMGDLCQKKLIVELMGKYSNIILTDGSDTILDSIKRINAMTSSVREVLPGLSYFVPSQEGRINPLTATEVNFNDLVFSKNCEPTKALYSSFTGISPRMAGEIVYNAVSNGMNDIASAAESDPVSRTIMWQSFREYMTRVSEGRFEFTMLLENGNPVDYSVLGNGSYNEYITLPSASALLVDFYRKKEENSRRRQKSADLRRIVSTILERDIKKYDLQCKQLKDTEKMDKYRLYGELLHTYGYMASSGDSSIKVTNYYDNTELTIPLDNTKTAMENASAYFEKYNKLKRTKEALIKLTAEVHEEIEHLESIQQALDTCSREEDLNQIKEEMTDCGYIRFKSSSKQKQRFKSQPLHYVSSDGYDIYVGKNNYQNDELTFKFATGNDWWFHAKGIPGSHVVVKTADGHLSDRCFEEAGRLAAFYSKGSANDKVEIDYLQKKNVKKPAGAKPGFVVYYTNYSMVIDTDISGIKQVTGS
ncbi:MAG: NFACT family protein [Lachnospiraceae bacterium]|nr:NFACT family protein [Lachnospiraceae bacterium]